MSGGASFIAATSRAARDCCNLNSVVFSTFLKALSVSFPSPAMASDVFLKTSAVFLKLPSVRMVNPLNARMFSKTSV